MAETGLTTLEATLDIPREPNEVLDAAAKAAKALKAVVDKKEKKVIINDETYLEFEDWQTVGRFYGITPQVISTGYVEFGTAKGFEAVANAIHAATGRVVSSAEAMCLNDEPNWEHKPLFQLRSMAQTRACAKALRNCLAWVVVLAGYKPTPAEEMMAEHLSEHWCPLHNTEWFKRGSMKWFAHPIKDTKEWCAEAKVKKQLAEQEEQQSDSQEPAVSAKVETPPKTETPPSKLTWDYFYGEAVGKGYAKNDKPDMTAILNALEVKRMSDWTAKYQTTEEAIRAALNKMVDKTVQKGD